ncbi:hypothetical protein [Vallitalea sp.]|uniref:hypothetical protein n=1 Tax=Vallitalea sp. TaxID=1882829 RepID=UPI0025F82FD0|nr:hypothetical protein [Vallitalea sp.]MCT4686045.1 hypothetical protein [Vallitalea sp.]
MIEDKENIEHLSKKLIYTLCYAFAMLAIGVLYMTSISLSILADILIIVLFIISFIDHNRFISRTDLTEINKSKSS